MHWRERWFMRRSLLRAAEYVGVFDNCFDMMRTPSTHSFIFSFGYIVLSMLSNQSVENPPRGKIYEQLFKLTSSFFDYTLNCNLSFLDTKSRVESKAIFLGYKIVIWIDKAVLFAAIWLTYSLPFNALFPSLPFNLFLFFLPISTPIFAHKSSATLSRFYQYQIDQQEFAGKSVHTRKCIISFWGGLEMILKNLSHV